MNDIKKEFHEIAEIFPAMLAENLKTLTADIKKNGLKETIWLFEDKILDGRNRYLACKSAGVVPKYCTFEGSAEEALSHVWSLNFERRHLNAGQTALVSERFDRLYGTFDAVRKAAKGARPGPKPKSKRSNRLIGSISKHERTTAGIKGRTVGVNSKYIEYTPTLLDRFPHLTKKIDQGEISMATAIQEVIEARALKRKEKKKDEEQKRKGWLHTQPLRPPAIGMQFARIAVMKLEEITEDDTERQQAFDYVRRWIDERNKQD